MWKILIQTDEMTEAISIQLAANTTKYVFKFTVNQEMVHRQKYHGDTKAYNSFVLK